MSDHIRDRLLLPVNLLNGRRRMPSLAELRETENHREVWALCDNRMLLGAFRYELLADKERRGTAGYDVLSDALRRIGRYQDSGNLEHLLDAINMLAIEYRFPSHPTAHFEASDDGQHARKTVRRTY